MNLTKFINIGFFKIQTLILAICLLDQLYMRKKYDNTSRETIILTLILLALSCYFGFFSKKKHIDSQAIKTGN